MEDDNDISDKFMSSLKKSISSNLGVTFNLFRNM
jgi:hypothetical protein